jgi:hypothetical protein
MITVTVIRTTSDSPISKSHVVTVPDVAAAINHMALYESDTDMISFSVESTVWLGSGIAGNGRFQHSLRVAAESQV